MKLPTQLWLRVIVYSLASGSRFPSTSAILTVSVFKALYVSTPSVYSALIGPKGSRALSARNF